MLGNDIRDIDRSCMSYRPGHRMHWIQAKKASEDGQRVIDVTVVVHSDGRVDLGGDDLRETMWTHDPARLQEAWDKYGHAVWKPRYHVLSLPGLSGYAFNMAAGSDPSPCLRKDLTTPAATATDVDPALRSAQERDRNNERLGVLHRDDT